MSETDVESLAEVVVELKEKIRVLHVDDDAALLKIAKQCLEIEAPVQIDTATSVDEASAKLEKENYDVVVSDYKMSGKDGLEFLKELREKGNMIPFIIFTGKGREEVAIKALNLGANQYLNKSGDPETVYCELAHAITEVAERKRAQEEKQKATDALSQTKMLLDSIINSTKDLIWSVDADDFRLLTFNKALYDYFLRTQNLRLEQGMTQEEIMPNEQLAQKWRELNKRVLKEGQFSIEYSTFKEPRVLEMTFNVLAKEEKPFAIAVFAKDVTEKKKVEEALKESVEKYRDLTNSLPEIVYEADVNGKLTFMNERAFEISGYTKHDFERGLSAFAFFAPGDEKSARQNYDKILSGEPSATHEYTFQRKDGTKFPVLVRSERAIKGNTVIGVRGIVMDVSLLKKLGNSIPTRACDRVREKEGRKERKREGVGLGFGELLS